MDFRETPGDENSPVRLNSKGAKSPVDIAPVFEGPIHHPVGFEAREIAVKISPDQDFPVRLNGYGINGFILSDGRLKCNIQIAVHGKAGDGASCNLVIGPE